MKEKRKEVTPRDERELEGPDALLLLFVNVAALVVGGLIGIVLLIII